MENENEKGIRTTFRLPKDLHKKFKKYCIESDITMSEFLINSINRVINENVKEKK